MRGEAMEGSRLSELRHMARLAGGPNRWALPRAEADELMAEVDRARDEEARKERQIEMAHRVLADAQHPEECLKNSEEDLCTCAIGEAMAHLEGMTP